MQQYSEFTVSWWCLLRDSKPPCSHHISLLFWVRYLWKTLRPSCGWKILQEVPGLQTSVLGTPHSYERPAWQGALWGNQAAPNLVNQWHPLSTVLYLSRSLALSLSPFVNLTAPLAKLVVGLPHCTCAMGILARGAIWFPRWKDRLTYGGNKFFVGWKQKEDHGQLEVGSCSCKELRLPSLYWSSGSRNSRCLHTATSCWQCQIFLAYHWRSATTLSGW